MTSPSHMQQVVRTCKHGPCGKSFEPTDSRQEFCDSTCRANHHYAAHPEKGRSVQPTALQSVATHPLVEVREAQEATKLKDHYSQVIYQGIVERLERGSVHADDLEDLFPDSDRTMCRKLVGAQFGSLASRHYIHEVERRKSSVPTRKGAKSGVFEFTRLGREKLAGVTTGVASPQGTQSAASHCSMGASSDPGDGSSVHGRQPTHGAGEPRLTNQTLSLLPEPPKLFDDDTPRAA